MSEGAAGVSGVDVGAASDVGDGKPLVIAAERLGREDPVVIFSDDGRLYALDLWCTHGMASLADGWVENGQVECPLHGALFNLADGVPQCPPATEPVPTHQVRDVNGRLILQLSD